MNKILLINPHETEQSGFTNPPIGLLYIAGTLLKHNFEVKVVDGCLEGRSAINKVLEEFRPSYVGITALTPGRIRAVEIADLAKKFNPGITVILGGVHPTIMYQQMMEHYRAIDYIVLGEGEQACLEIVQGNDPVNISGIVYRKGDQIIKTSQRKYIGNLDEIPFPAWHLLDLNRYPAIGRGTIKGINMRKVPRISVIFSRGCSGHCDFCSTWWIWRGWRHRSARNMAEEIDSLYTQHGIRHFCFADDAMTVDRQATIELCDEIISRKLNIIFHVTTRTDCVDEHVLRKLKEAGCYNIAFGIETGSALLLDKMGKANDIETSERAIKLAKEAGIKVTALMIVGNVGETRHTMQESIDFLKRTQPDEVGCVGGLWIFPGTKIYRDAKKQGYIDDDFWLKDEPYKIYALEYSRDQLAHMEQQIYAYKGGIYRALTAMSRAIGRMLLSAKRMFS
jgi:anaerobic magnesium-protoporphyrin IX monomethyl ester cyclase